MILRLAGGMGMRRPSSAGSVILTMLRMKLMPFTVSRTYLNFSSEMLGVKFMRMVLMWLRVLTWSRKWSDSLSKLLHSRKEREGHRFNS